MHTAGFFYAHFMVYSATIMNTTCLYTSVSGIISAPPSKSSMQRAVACAMLADGISLIRNPAFCDDARAAMGIASAFGAGAELSNDSVQISGSPLFKNRTTMSENAGSLEVSCGESGLSMRMFAPISALLSRPVRLVAHGSLTRRSMVMVQEALNAMGVSCDSADGLPPLTVKGPLLPGIYHIDAGASSQFLTGLLMALPLLAGDSVLRVSNPVSTGYLDLTVATMGLFSVKVEHINNYSRFEIPGGQRYVPATMSVEGDWSGAAFLLAAAALGAKERPLRIENLQPASSQPDRAILTVLEAVGADVVAEPNAVSVRSNDLRPFDFDAADCPDLFPPLAVLAAACHGTSRIHGTRRLAGKESNRALTIQDTLGTLGARIHLEDDDMIIEGSRLHGGAVDAHQDHRIAMMAAVASLAAGEPVIIMGSECVAKSWPGFFTDFASISDI